MAENTVKKQRGKRKIVKKVQQETAIEKPVTDDEKRLVEGFRERVMRAQTLPCFKDRTLGMAGHENARDISVGLAYGAIMDLCKTDHPDAAMKIITGITSVRTSDNPDK